MTMFVTDMVRAVAFISVGAIYYLDALAVEHSDSNPYKSIIGTRAELVGTPKIQAIEHAYHSDHMKQTLLKLYAADTSAVVFLW